MLQKTTLLELLLSTRQILVLNILNSQIIFCKIYLIVLFYFLNCDLHETILFVSNNFILRTYIRTRILIITIYVN